MKCYCLLVMLVFAGLLVRAQDLHYSQYMASPLNLNPALAGSFDGDFRISANQRTQWASVTMPYKTMTGASDMRLLGHAEKRGMLCAGVFVNQDQAGTSQLGLFQSNASLSYTLRLDAAAHHFFGAGMQGGFAQKSINYNNLIFDEQYNGDAQDLTLPSGESFANSGFSYTDWNGGIHYAYRSSGRFRADAGAAYAHLNKPMQASFLSAQSSVLAPKLSLHGSLSIPFTSGTSIQPSLLYQHQGAFSELLLGSDMQFDLENKIGFNNNLFLGLHYRTTDALIVLTGMTYNNIRVGVSYDINTSGLKPASRSRGGFEFSIAYIFKKVSRLSDKKPCPTYL